MDWLHALLHKLEGDFRNAKMWYTDLGNTNAGASSDDNDEANESERGKTQTFRRFHEFWFVPAANGGKGSKKDAKSLDLDTCDDLPQRLQLTAHGHADLVFLASLVLKASSSKGINHDWAKGEIKKHHSATTLAENKIKLSQSTFDLDDLQLLYCQLAHSISSQSTVRCLTQLELIWLLGAMVQDFGWREYTTSDTVEALKVEFTPTYQRVDEARKSKASNMVLTPAQGQRKL